MSKRLKPRLIPVRAYTSAPHSAQRIKLKKSRLPEYKHTAYREQTCTAKQPAHASTAGSRLMWIFQTMFFLKESRTERETVWLQLKQSGMDWFLLQADWNFNLVYVASLFEPRLSTRRVYAHPIPLTLTYYPGVHHPCRPTNLLCQFIWSTKVLTNVCIW